MTVKMKVSITLTQPDVAGASENVTTTWELFGVSLPAVRKATKKLLDHLGEIGTLPFEEKESDA